MANPKPRQIKVDQRSQIAAMQRLETLSDDELKAQTKYKAAALAILGSRAAEKYDAKAARGYFQKAMAAARPQERLQIKRMADASLALAERRPDDLKAAVEKLGQEGPSKRQMMALRFMRLIVPSPGASLLIKARAVLAVLAIVILLLALGTAVVELIAWPFGGMQVGGAAVLGVIVIGIALGVLGMVGRRRQARMKAERAAAAAPAVKGSRGAKGAGGAKVPGGTPASNGAKASNGASAAKSTKTPKGTPTPKGTKAPRPPKGPKDA
jgi:hypothetical protein